MLFRQLFEKETSTYTYLLADEQTREAALIDPVLEMVERDVAYIQELGLDLVWILDTHVHADHITGAAALKKHFQQARYALGKNSQLETADTLLGHKDEVFVGGIQIVVLETPGHTDNSVSYLADNMLFTGDAVLIRGCGRTDFQSGSNHELWTAIHEHIFTLPDEIFIYPGHDYKGFTVSTVGEEKKYNPRLRLENTQEQFADIMNNLNLPYPNKIDEALPANMRGGEVN